MEDLKRQIEILAKVIEVTEEAVKANRLDDVAPNILLDELASPSDVKTIEEVDLLANIMSYIEHHYDATTHNFDQVIDDLSMEESIGLLSKLRRYLDGKDDIPDKVRNFKSCL